MVITEFELPYKIDIAPRGSVGHDSDLQKRAQPCDGTQRGRPLDVDLAFQVMFDTLKPGGILGVVDHEWDDADNRGSALRPMATSPELAPLPLPRRPALSSPAESEILHNPRDTKDHPAGVWTLPPSFANGDEDRAEDTKP